MRETNSESDPLDKLLLQARWPEADAERLRRLQSRWQELSAETSLQRTPLPPALFAGMRAHTVMVGAPVAAALLIAFAFWAVRPSSQTVTSDQDDLTAELPLTLEKFEPESLEREESQVVVTQETTEDVVQAPALVREPTMYELALVARHRHRSGMADSSAAPDTTVIVTQNQLPLEDTAELLKALSVPNVSKRREAARQLAAKQDPQVSAYLIRMTQNEAVRREALIALSLSTDQVAQRYLQHASQDLTIGPSLRAIQVMLSRR
jgi:hypothetical protein